MRWLQNISFSSSSSPSSSSNSFSTASSSSFSPKPTFSSSSSSSSSSSADPNFSPAKKNTHHRSYLRGGPLGLRFSAPRLMRQRKLRQLTEQEIATQQQQRQGTSIATVKPHSDTSSEPIPVQLSRSPSGSCSAVPSRLSSSVPVPLPLPLPLRENSNFGDAHKERDREGLREKEKERNDGVGEGLCSSNSPIASALVGRNTRKIVEPLDVRRSPSNPDFSVDNYGVNLPTRSAPTSPFGSPVLSPQKLTTAADLLPYYQMIARGNQVWSAPEMATLDIPGLPPPAFFDYSAFSTDNSPLHSPRSRSPRWKPKSPTGPASPLNARLSVDALIPGRESNANLEVHPLPLPPGAARPSISTPIPQIIAKAESVPLKSQWQKGKLIGRGTFGSVYVASNRETGALCAMKEVDIFPDDPKSAESIKQLEQEIKVLSQLKHPNIVQYYGSEIVEDHFYIYLEYVHPGSINKYAREHCGAITENVVRSFTRHIVSGLAYLHSMKTIHRDIKGANLLVDASGVVKLADFGMSKHLTGQAAELSLKGSPYWMAPELMQAVMQKDTSPDLALVVDIWSLGCTIIEMFTGKPPWSDFEGAAAMFKVLKDSPPIPETLSPEGKDFLRCCFRRNPADRASASVLLEHRWLKNSQQLDVPSTTQSTNGIKLMDISHNHSPNISEKFDQLSITPVSQNTKGKVASDSETAQRSHHETSNLTTTMASSCYSPRSILEVLPTLSPLRAGQRNHASSSSSTPNLINYSAKINHVFR